MTARSVSGCPRRHAILMGNGAQTGVECRMSGMCRVSSGVDDLYHGIPKYQRQSARRRNPVASRPTRRDARRRRDARDGKTVCRPRLASPLGALTVTLRDAHTRADRRANTQQTTQAFASKAYRSPLTVFKLPAVPHSRQNTTHKRQTSAHKSQRHPVCSLHLSLPQERITDDTRAGSKRLTTWHPRARVVRPANTQLRLRLHWLH